MTDMVERAVQEKLAAMDRVVCRAVYELEELEK